MADSRRAVHPHALGLHRLPKGKKPLNELQRELIKLLARSAAREFLAVEEQHGAPTPPAAA